jgi:hypothetical protein
LGSVLIRVGISNNASAASRSAFSKAACISPVFGERVDLGNKISRAAQSHLSRIVGESEYQNMTIRNWKTTGKLPEERHEPQAAAAPWALEHIDPERPSHQIGPEIRAGAPATGRVTPVGVGRAGAGRRVGPF